MIPSQSAAALVVLCGMSFCGCNEAAAQTDLKISGTLDIFAASWQPSGEKRSNVLDSGGMTTSFWGLNGSEQLTSGMKLTFALESYVRVDTGASGRSDTDPMFAKNAYIGLGGRFGEVRIGRQTNPLFSATILFSSTGGSTRWSPTLNQLWTSFGRIISGDTTRPNSIGYYSPTIDGFSGRAVYSTAEVIGQSNINNYGGMILYEGGPIATTLVAQRTRFGPGISENNTEEKVYMVGGSYDLHYAKLFSQYVKKNAAGAIPNQRMYSLGATVQAGRGEVITAWARTRSDSLEIGKTFRNSAMVGYDFKLSKRSDLYVNYLYDKLTAEASGNSIGIGIRHSF